MKYSTQAKFVLGFAYVATVITLRKLPLWAWLIGWATTLSAAIIVPWLIEQMEK